MVYNYIGLDLVISVGTCGAPGASVVTSAENWGLTVLSTSTPEDAIGQLKLPRS